MHDTGGRLALFIADLGAGGAQRSMSSLATAFAARGHPVDLLAVRPEGSLRAGLSPAVRLVDLDRPWHQLPLIRKKRRRVMASALGLAGYLRRERPTALMATSHSVNVSASIAASLARVPTRLVLRMDSFLSRPVELVGAHTQRRRLRRARRFFPRADAIIAISYGVAEDVAEVTGVARERIAVVHNPVLTPELRERIRSSAAADHPWLAPGEPPALVSVGRLVAQKDFPTLLRAFAVVSVRRPARLLILGEGRERERLEAQVRELGLEDRVALPGFVADPLPYMRGAAALVLSSAWEGFGNVLVEALACGCPVVSTDCPSGPAEILEQGSFGPLVPVGDSAALAKAILGVLDHPLPPERLRERAEHFSVERSAEGYLPVLLG